MSLKKTIKNFLSLSFAEFIGKFFGFIALVYLARVISPESFGIIAFTTAFVSYFLLFVELGFDVVCVRDIAKDSSEIKKYVNNVVSTKLINSLILFVLLTSVTMLIEKSTLEKTCILIYGFILFTQAGNLDFVFQGVEQFRFISYKVIGKSVLYLLLIFFFVKGNSDTYKILVFIVISTTIFTIWQFYEYGKQYSLFTFEIDKQFIKKLFKESYPLMISTLMATIYSSLDIVMLGFMKTNYEVGIYNASYKIMLIAYIPLGILLKIFLPSLARFGKNYRFKKDLQSFTVLMIFMGIVVMVPLFFLSESVLRVSFGSQYLAAEIPLKIFLANGLIMCMSIAFGNPLTVWGEQRFHAAILTLGAITNIVLNIILIPNYSFNGAALATLFSEVVVFLGVTVVFIKSIRPLYSKVA